MKTTDLSTMSFLDNCKSKPFESGDPTDGWPTNNSVCLYIKNGVDFYFARKGTIVTKPNNDGNLEATLSGDIRLVQIDTGTGLDKDGGECIELRGEKSEKCPSGIIRQPATTTAIPATAIGDTGLPSPKSEVTSSVKMIGSDRIIG